MVLDWRKAGGGGRAERGASSAGGEIRGANVTCANCFPQSVQDDPASPGPVRETLLAVDHISFLYFSLSISFHWQLVLPQKALSSVLTSVGRKSLSVFPSQLWLECGPQLKIRSCYVAGFSHTVFHVLPPGSEPHDCSESGHLLYLGWYSGTDH